MLRIHICMQEKITKEKDLAAINAFYKERGYTPGALATDILLVAKNGRKIIGAVRLCYEEGVWVLRGMHVLDEFQRQGIGTALLRQAEETLGNRITYLVCKPELYKFYGVIGFEPISDREAPIHLQKRVVEYRSKNSNRLFTLMKRAPADLESLDKI